MFCLSFLKVALEATYCTGFMFDSLQCENFAHHPGGVSHCVLLNSWKVLVHKLCGGANHF
uniref:Uncharacterized protein n=1 Tax=Arundo donax TaxID=35708 RepID=A0A0A9CYQ1_ARUDO